MRLASLAEAAKGRRNRTTRTCFCIPFLPTLRTVPLPTCPLCLSFSFLCKTDDCELSAIHPPYRVTQPCDTTLPSAPNLTRYVKGDGAPGRARANRKSLISTTASCPSLRKRVTGKRSNHSTLCTSGKRLPASM